MNKLSKNLLIILIISLTSTIAGNNIRAAEPLTISKNFTLFTSQNMMNYLQPLFTSIEQSLNSNIYTGAEYRQKFYFGLDLSAMGMFIPDGQKNFNAERPDLYGNTTIVKTAEIRGGGILRDVTNSNTQPTIYGGTSTPIFAVPQNDFPPDSFYKSSGYVEGNNISFMSGLPVLQLIFGIPTRTEFRFRFWGAPVQNESLWYWGILFNQQFDHWFKLFPEKYQMSLALNGGYNSISRNPGLSLYSWNVGVHFSKIWDFQKSGKVTGYFGFQLEDMKGTFEAIKTYDSTSTRDVVASPYLEVREPIEYAKQKGWKDENGKPKPMLRFDIQSINKYRILLGFSYKYSFLELHGDFAYAKQPILTAGLTFWLGSFGGKKDMEPEEKIEKIEENR